MSMGISKAEISEKGITASGSIGGQKGNVGISRDGVVELGINIGIAEIGFSTDYGGSVVVGFAGQNIVWGLEGGKISIRFGGIFEVDVEARDCVVTEIKRIAGMVVSSRTYPDPGCKLPPEPGLTRPNLPSPQGDGTEQLGQGIAWVFVNGKMNGSFLYDVQYYPGIFLLNTGSQTVTVEGPEELINGNLDLSKCTTISKANNSTTLISGVAPQFWYDNGVFGNRNATGFYSYLSSSWVFPPGGGYARIYGFGNYTQTSNVSIPLNYSGTGFTGTQGLILHGEQSVIKAYILKYNSDQVKQRHYSTEMLQVSKVLPRQVLPRKVSPTAGNRPPMPESCCETLKADIQDIKDVLDIKNLKKVKGQNKGRMLEKSIPIESGKKRVRLEEKTFTTYAGAFDAIFSELEAFQSVLQSDYLIEKKFPVPSYLLFPGVDSEHTHEVDSYYSLFATLLQAMAHGMIISPEVHMRDPTTGKTGDEGLTSKYLSATGWAEAITKMLYKTIDEGNTSINMDVRNGITVTQLAVAVANISHKLDALIDCIGVPTTRSKGEIETSFSLIDDSGQGQGFDPKKSNKQLDLNDGMATEQLLAMLLKTRKNPIVKEVMAPKAKSLSQLIQELKGG